MTKRFKLGYPVYATIRQGNVQVDRRVYEDENGVAHVKLNRDFYSVDWLRAHGDGVFIWF